MTGGKADLANEQQNILCATSDGSWLDYREAKQRNRLETLTLAI